MANRTPRVLAIEDNPITQRLLRATLVPAGFELVVAADGSSGLQRMAERAPDLVLLDLVLPDMDGYQLLRLLRNLPGGREVPVLAFSGFLTEHDESRLAAAGFDDLITKPLEPTALVRALRSHLPEVPPADAQTFGRGRRLLLVDDDPVQLKLSRLLLSHHGFDVTSALDGEEALSLARARPPDAIVTDALMPRLDGFGLCIAARRDERLAKLPIIVATASYLDEADRDLARQAGADALVVRTPDLREVIAALRTRLQEHPVARTSASDDDRAMELERARRAVHQLERQVALNSGLRRQCSMLGAQLSVIGAISGALIESRDADPTIHEMLATCLDAVGASCGAIALGAPGGTLTIHASHGLDADVSARLLDALHARRAVPSRESADETVLDLGLPAGPALVLPLGTGRRARPGVVVLVGQPVHSTDGEWRSFARAIASQLGAALALAESFHRLSAAEARQRALMEGAADAIFVIGSDGLVREANGGAGRLLGCPRDQIVGRAARDFVSDDDAARAREYLAQSHAGGAGGWHDMHVLRADGTRVPVEATHSRVETADGSMVISIVRDATERHALAARLRDAQKMEAIGRLAGGIAHDFNNLLAVITSYSELILEDLPAGMTAVRDDVEQISHAASSAAALTRQLLAFSRRQVLKPVRLDVNHVVTGIEKMLRRLVGTDVEIAASLSPRLWSVVADPGQLEQVLMNLAANARDAMPEGGRLTIATSNASVDGAPRADDHDVPPGEYVRLAVSDSGVGMDADTQQRVFEPFFTTKEVGKGTGLGLATIHGIVEQSGGHIRVDSEIGRGTRFRIYFPRATTASEPSRPPSGPPRPATSPDRARIVLVEDEPRLRAAIQRILQEHGHSVRAAADGGEALELVAVESEPADLLITDLVMPAMGGFELAGRVATRWPRVRALFMSGHAGGLGAAGTLPASTPFLQKPFTPEQLLRAVTEALNTARATAQSDDGRTEPQQ